jgi:hypothetical protein
MLNIAELKTVSSRRVEPPPAGSGGLSVAGLNYGDKMVIKQIFFIQ